MRLSILIVPLFFCANSDELSFCSINNKNSFYLLCVGTDCYAKDLSSDDFVKEAQLFESCLLSRVDKRYNIQPFYLYHNAATGDNLLKYLYLLSKIVKPDDYVVIYFSLHGSNFDGNSYKCHTRERAITAEEIQDVVDTFCCSYLMIVDTCYAGSILDNWKYPRSDSTILCACFPNQIAGVFYFVWPFEEAVVCGDLNKNGLVEIGELSLYIYNDMISRGFSQRICGWNILSDKALCFVNVQ